MLYTLLTVSSVWMPNIFVFHSDNGPVSHYCDWRTVHYAFYLLKAWREITQGPFTLLRRIKLSSISMNKRGVQSLKPMAILYLRGPQVEQFKLLLLRFCNTLGTSSCHDNTFYQSWRLKINQSGDDWNDYCLASLTQAFHRRQHWPWREN